MGVVDQKRELFENMVRLRRAARGLPGNRDLSTVRISLERELGETVSRRFAARALGVTHTALNRWIDAGEFPVVYTPSGRLEVPVNALLQLREAVDVDQRNDAGRFRLAPTMARQREAAMRLKLTDRKSGAESGHSRASARSLAYHSAIASRLDQSTLDEARHVLLRWQQQGRIDRSYAARWEGLLDQPIREIRETLLDESTAGDDLRQNSPFAGLLSEPERRRILSEVS
ncbi:MAG: hypothetical protein ACHQHO_04585 [Solirubrobacterales bacterium]